MSRDEIFDTGGAALAEAEQPETASREPGADPGDLRRSANMGVFHYVAPDGVQLANLTAPNYWRKLHGALGEGDFIFTSLPTQPAGRMAVILHVVEVRHRNDMRTEVLIPQAE